MQICKPGNLLNTWGETSEESSVPVKNAFWLFVRVCFRGSRHFLSYGMLNVEERTIWRWHILNAQGLISCDGIRLTHAFPRFLWMPWRLSGFCCKKLLYRWKNICSCSFSEYRMLSENNSCGRRFFYSRTGIRTTLAEIFAFRSMWKTCVCRIDLKRRIYRRANWNCRFYFYSLLGFGKT